MTEPLNVFFAVTTTSLYHVEYKPDDVKPFVKKIACVGESDVGIGNHLLGGYNLGIMARGLVVYGTDRELPELVNTDLWGGGSSPIVGLFLQEIDASTCLNSGKLLPLDPEWREHTEETLAAIGTDHPKFVLSLDDAIQ